MNGHLSCLCVSGVALPQKQACVQPSAPCIALVSHEIWAMLCFFFPLDYTVQQKPSILLINKQSDLTIVCMYRMNHLSAKCFVKKHVKKQALSVTMRQGSGIRNRSRGEMGKVYNETLLRLHTISFRFHFWWFSYWCTFVYLCLNTHAKNDSKKRASNTLVYCRGWNDIIKAQDKV